MHWGHGAHAQETPTTATLDRVVKEQPTELTGRQPHHEQRRPQLDRGYGTRTQLLTAARSDGRETESANLQNTSKTSGSSLVTLPQEPIATWDGGEGRRDSEWGPTGWHHSSSPPVTTQSDTLTTTTAL